MSLIELSEPASGSAAAPAASSADIAALQNAVQSANSGDMVSDDPQAIAGVLPGDVNADVGDIGEMYVDEYHVGGAGEDLGTLGMAELLHGMTGGFTDADELAAYKETDEYKFYKDFAESAGLGDTDGDIINKLQLIVNEYDANKADYDQYLLDLAAYQRGELAEEPAPVAEPTLPRYTVNSVDIVLGKTTEEQELGDNGDGTHSLTGTGVNGYKVQVDINANAAYTVYYEGEQTITVTKPVEGEGTDFVITLDASGSMRGRRGDAMLEALEVVLGEILTNEKNTVSIVFYSDTAGVLEMDIDGDGSAERTFSAADVSLTELFNTPVNGSSLSLRDIISDDDPISVIESFITIGSSTNTAGGLDLAYQVLEAVYGSEDATADSRNIGVLLFTDGDANVGGTDPKGSVVVSEADLAEKFDATVVNVALGTSSTYTYYMDPSDPNYIYNATSTSTAIMNDYTPDREALLKEKVVYYNIPDISNDTLAEEITTLFQTAFKTITTTEVQLTTEVLTDGILAAVQTTLIDTVPSTMEIVKLRGDTPTYRLLGKDADGNTLIAWDVGNMYAGDHYTFSYFLVPVDAGKALECTIASGIDTVLVSNPVDKVVDAKQDEITQIAIVHRAAGDSGQTFHPAVPQTGEMGIPAFSLVICLLLSLALFLAARRRAR